MNRLRVRLALLLLAVACPWPASGAAGDLDPRFGTGGTVQLDCGAAAFAIQPDGGVVTAGSADEDDEPYFALTRRGAARGAPG